MEVEITTKNFETYKNGELPLVVDLWATWCGPCRMVAPIISELAQEYDGKLVVGKCDVEENDDIAMEFGVRNIPTVLFFKGPPRISSRRNSRLCWRSKRRPTSQRKDIEESSSRVALLFLCLSVHGIHDHLLFVEF